MVGAALLPAIGTRAVTIAVAHRSQLDSGLTEAVVASLGTHRGQQAVISPTTARRASRDALRGEWIDVPLAEGMARIDHARLPSTLDRQRDIRLINDLTAPRRTGRPLVIGAWSGFAHPFQRAGAFLDWDRDGLTPEIASAVRPAQILLGLRWSMGDMLLSGSDQVATEVAARAVGVVQADPGTIEAGAWEHPLVQRGTEIQLGVATPAQIRVRAGWLAPDDASGRAAFLRVVDQIRMAMGVESDVTVD